MKQTFYLEDTITGEKYRFRTKLNIHNLNIKILRLYTLFRKNPKKNIERKWYKALQNNKYKIYKFVEKNNEDI